MICWIMTIVPSQSSYDLQTICQKRRRPYVEFRGTRRCRIRHECPSGNQMTEDISHTIWYKTRWHQSWRYILYKKIETSCDGGGHTNMFWDAYSILLFLVLTEYLNMLLYGERNSVDRMKRTTWGFCSCSLQSKTIRVCGRVRTWDSWKRKCIPTQYARIV